MQAGLIGFGLFLFASKVEGIVYSRDLPSGYTVGMGATGRGGACMLHRVQSACVVCSKQT